MKFAFVIAALFAASAIAAPCTRRHVDDEATDMTPMDDSTGMDSPATGMEDSAPVDDNTPLEDGSVSSDPPSSTLSSVPPHDEGKTSTGGGESDQSQTAVINNDSPDKGGKGSLFGLDTSSILAGGVLGGTDNAVNQHHAA